MEHEDLRSHLEPEGIETDLPEGLDLDVFPDYPNELLEVYDLATGNVNLDEESLEDVEFGDTQVAGKDVVPAAEDPATVAQDTKEDRERPAGNGDGELPDWDMGSNTFAVAPEHTAGDGAMLASDPHRAQAVPSLRYLAHLNAPDLDVVGAREPGLPGLSLGHNGQIAFGLTIFGIDQEDLYVYETNPDDPNEYRYDDSWEPMRVEAGEVAVRGGDAETVELKFTRHGLVIYEDEEQNIAFAVRTAWSEPGMGAYFGSIEYMRAQNWREFLGAMNRWGSPPENQQYIDADGNIGWKPGGMAPRRPNWDGLLPVPGDGQYEWAGFYDMDQLPESFNPDKGWNQTNNEMRLFDEFITGPVDEYVERGFSCEWAPPWRALRTREIIEAIGEIDTDSATVLEAWELLTEEQQQRIAGFGSLGSLTLSTARINPMTGCKSWLPVELRYNPDTNPDGARCDLFSATKNVYGVDDETGLTKRPLDNVGIQYGLAALEDGTITVDEFLDLNEGIGGYDIDANVIPERTEADLDATAAAYRSGRLLNGGGGLGEVPIVDIRTYTDERAGGDVHMRFHGFSTRNACSRPTAPTTIM